MKLPKKIGDCIDLAYLARAERLKLQKEMEEKLEKLKAKEREIEEYIIDNFDAQSINGAKGAVASASVSLSINPSVKDWPKVWKYIAKNEAWDLMEKRIAKVAYRERLEAGQAIPGVETFQKKTLSLTKI
jgi:citrate synthase